MRKSDLTVVFFSFLFAIPAVTWSSPSPDPKAADPNLKKIEFEIEALSRKAAQAYLAGKPLRAEVPDAALKDLEKLAEARPEARGTKAGPGVAAPGAPQNLKARLEELRKLREQAIGVQEGRDPQEEIAVFVASVELVAERLQVDKKAAVALYRERVRGGAAGPGGQAREKTPAQLELEAEAVRRMLENPKTSPELTQRLMARAGRYASALGGLVFIDGAGNSVVVAPGGESRRLTPQELAQLNGVPRVQLPAGYRMTGREIPPPDRKADAASQGGAPSPSWRERAAEWLKDKGLQLNLAADRQKEENNWAGFSKFGKKTGGLSLLIAGHVTEKAPEWGEKAAAFGRRLGRGEWEAYKQTGVGAGHFVKDAVVGIWTGVKDAGGAWQSFGNEHTTTYQGLKATALTVLAVSNVIPTGKGQIAKTAVREGMMEAAEATGRQGLKQLAKRTAVGAAEEGMEGAGRLALRRSPVPMVAAVERSQAVASETRTLTREIARETRTGQKWFGEGNIREAVPLKAAEPVPKPAQTRMRSLEETKSEYLELMQRSQDATDAAERKALDARRTVLFEQVKSGELMQTPEFARIQQLQISREEKSRLVQALVETQVHPDLKERTARIAQSMLQELPDMPVEKAGIADQAASQILEGRLRQSRLGSPQIQGGKDSVRDAYRQTLNRPNSINHAITEVWADAARKGEGEFVETAGGQFMRQQSRGTCPWHATCNLFRQEIEQGSLDTKDILRQAYEYNPNFASRSAEKGIAENGLKTHQIRELVEATAGKVGKTSVPVPPEEIVRHMQQTGQPVMVMIRTSEKGGGHVMLVGKPFTMPGPNNTTKVVLQTFDGNNPTGVAGYIDADKLGQLMTGDGIAVVDKGSPLVAKAARSAAPSETTLAEVLRPTERVSREIERLRSQGRVSEQGLARAIAQRSTELGETARAKRLQANALPSASPARARLLEEASDLDARSKELFRYTSAAGVPIAGVQGP